MTDAKTIGFVFIEGFADWEYGFLAAAASDWFSVAAVALTPGGTPVRSAAGFAMTPHRGLEPGENDDLDAVAVIGAEGWTAAGAPDPGPLLHAVAARGGVVGGICAGTLALARAGLFEGRAHTSNGRVWIADHLPVYAGQGHYRDVPHAVADERIVSAPGSAPVTFATAFLEALLPAESETLARMRALFASEHAGED
jgi:putative intracellular protease/amidase